MKSNEALIIPSFPHGETINSYLLRYANFNGGRSLRQECMRISRANPSLDCLPSSVRQFCEAFNFRFGNEDMVLQNHTLFPFYSCGLPLAGPNTFVEKFKSKRRGPVRPTRLGALISPAEKGCLSCPECDAENERSLGFSFDHRRYAIPFIHVCPIHEVELVRAPGKRALTFDTQCRTKGAGIASLLLEYAKRADEIFAAEGADSSNPYAKSRVISQLKRAGCIAENGRWALSQMLVRFHSLFDDAFADERLRCICQSDRQVTNAIRALQRNDRAVHPLWCILFRWLADVAEFKQPENTARQRPRAAPPAEQTIRDTVVRCRTLTQAARILEMDVSALSHFARSRGIEFQMRTKTVTTHVLGELTKRLEAGDSIAKIASDCKVSLSTVYRVRSTNPKYMNALKERCIEMKTEMCRARWCDVVRQASPLCHLTNLRRHNNALWTYLHRHDRTWLSQYKSKECVKTARAAFRPPEILRIAAEAVLKSARECSPTYGRPEHLSRYRIERWTGLSEYALQHVLTHLHTQGLSPDFSREAFLIARLKWWTGLANDQTPWAAKWKCARAAGLRVSSYDGALKLVLKNVHHERF